MGISKGNAGCHTFSRKGTQQYENINWVRENKCPHEFFLKTKRCKLNGLSECTGPDCKFINGGE